MTQVTLPLSDQQPLNLPELTSPSPNWMGRLVRWIRKSDDRWRLHQALLYAITLIVSAVLICTVVLSPLFLYGFSEFVREQERDRCRAYAADLYEIAKDNNQAQFLRGRLDPLSHLNLPLRSSTRKQMIQDLEIPREEARNKTDQELLIEAACKFNNYLERYRIEMRSRSSWLLLRLLGF